MMATSIVDELLAAAAADTDRLDRLDARLRAIDPGLEAQTVEVRRVLARLLPALGAQLERVQPLTTRFDNALGQAWDDLEGGWCPDGVFDVLQRRLGIRAMWALADQARDAHPEGFRPPPGSTAHLPYVPRCARPGSHDGQG
jgi:hypothetical protein